MFVFEVTADVLEINCCLRLQDRLDSKILRNCGRCFKCNSVVTSRTLRGSPRKLPAVPLTSPAFPSHADSCTLPLPAAIGVIPDAVLQAKLLFL
jgi:hypothetical protein